MSTSSLSLVCWIVKYFLYYLFLFRSEQTQQQWITLHCVSCDICLLVSVSLFYFALKISLLNWIFVCVCVFFFGWKEIPFDVEMSCCVGLMVEWKLTWHKVQLNIHFFLLSQSYKENNAIKHYLIPVNEWFVVKYCYVNVEKGKNVNLNNQIMEVWGRESK